MFADYAVDAILRKEASSALLYSLMVLGMLDQIARLKDIGLRVAPGRIADE
ncbi:hypothetical protein FHW83_002567 [Duganella sp. SG902]|uniref:hypothetical protein n=1 Tax=Duganella sp. SG902 TaxID=2587016 RepID=UPI0017E15690|nr:hypothetical protein [Duganella sp. SG902]NVM76766.1 hypothetical protein [Duganella sp. SG902]